MNNPFPTTVLIRSSLLLIVLLVAGFLFPFFTHVQYADIMSGLFSKDADTALDPLNKSLIFSALCSFIIVSLALLLSIGLRSISIDSSRATWLGVLLIPIITGNLSSAFVWKITLLDHPIFFRSYMLKFIMVGITLFWQYGTFFIYLFWLNSQFIPKDRLQYAVSGKLSFYETIRDMVLPVQRNLYALVYTVSFISFFYEETRIGLIFRSSRGTHTELISQWLNRLYRTDSSLSPDLAFTSVATASMMIFVAGLVGLLVMLGIKTMIFNKIVKGNRSFSFLRKTRYMSGWLLWALLCFVLFPLVYAVVKYAAAAQFSFGIFGISIGITFAAAVLATLFSIIFAMFCRIAWKNMLSEFNFRSMLFIIAVLMLLFIPPIVILISGFKWMQFIDYQSTFSVYIVWIISHVLLSFPLIAAFAIATHFRVSNRVLDFMAGHKVSGWRRWKDCFWGPLRVDYILILVLSFSTIWNETTVNSILSDTIPSFVTELNKTISGRGTDYGRAMDFLYIAILLSMASIFLWNIVLGKIQKEKSIK